MIDAFATVGEIISGLGALEHLGQIASGLGKRALVVTGSGSIEKAGILAKARDSLNAAGLVFDEHPGVLPEPDLATVELVRGRIHEGFDVAISIGGGSVIDVTKAAAGLCCEEGSIREYQAGREVHSIGIPHVAVPTTAGTGSEVTPNAVLTDPEGPRKCSIRGPGFVPAAAILDPSTLVSLPKRLTAECGMDALTQAIESYVSIHATPLTEALSLHAISLLAEGLPVAYDDPGDIDARTRCAYGSLLAGMALASARLGVVHGIVHPLGARLGLPHGLLCAVLLAPSIRLNTPAAGAKYDEVSRRLASGFSSAGSRGVTAPGLTQDEVSRRAPCADVLIEVLLERLELPKRIDGITKEHFADIVEDAMPSGSLKANPLKIEPQHVERLLQEVTA